MTTPIPPAGWHPDPEGRPQLRWWDGSQWTSATKPRAIQEGPKDPPPPIDPKVRKRNNLIAVGVIAVGAAVWIGISGFGSDDKDSTASSSGETTTATATTTTRASASTSASTRLTTQPIPSTTPVAIPSTTRVAPGAGLLPPAQTATAAGCDEPDPDIISAIEASLTEGRSINHVAAVSTLVDGIEYTYTAGNVFRADGSRSVSGAVWVTPGFGVMGLSGNTREVSTLPFGRGVLSVSAGDRYGQQVQECVSALARGR